MTVRKDRLTRLWPFELHRFKRGHHVGIEVDSPRGAVLSLRQVDGSAVEIDLAPSERILLGETHTGSEMQ